MLNIPGANVTRQSSKILSLVPQDRRRYPEVVHHELQNHFVTSMLLCFAVHPFHACAIHVLVRNRTSITRSACRVLNFQETAKEMIQMVKKLITAMVTAVTKVTPHLKVNKLNITQTHITQPIALATVPLVGHGSEAGGLYFARFSEPQA